jgi:hypothetical protein
MCLPDERLCGRALCLHLPFCIAASCSLCTILRHQPSPVLPNYWLDSHCEGEPKLGVGSWRES